MYLVYILGQPAIRKFGLILNIPEENRIRAVKLDTKDNKSWAEVGHKRRCLQSVSKTILWTG